MKKGRKKSLKISKKIRKLKHERHRGELEPTEADERIIKLRMKQSKYGDVKKGSKYEPEWLTKLKWLAWNRVGPAEKTNLLNESRKEMHDALRLYHAHVKYVIYIMISVPTAILIIMQFSSNGSPDPPFYIIAAGLLFLVLPIGLISIRIIDMYYRVYVSALVFATRLHMAGDYRENHPWLERTVKQAETWWFANDASRFLIARVNSPEDTFVQYGRIIKIIYMFSCAGGIALVVYLALPDIHSLLRSLGLLVLKLLGITI